MSSIAVEEEYTIAGCTGRRGGAHIAVVNRTWFAGVGCNRVRTAHVYTVEEVDTHAVPDTDVILSRVDH